MLPPSPLPFPLWGATFYAELTAGLWRALAAPWLAPGWPAQPGVAPRPQAGADAAGAGAVDGAACRESLRRAAPRGEAAPGGGGQVIRVPHARWRQRRG
jgi:hypothetical protein